MLLLQLHCVKWARSWSNKKNKKNEIEIVFEKTSERIQKLVFYQLYIFLPYLTHFFIWFYKTTHGQLSKKVKITEQNHVTILAYLLPLNQFDTLFLLNLHNCHDLFYHYYYLKYLVLKAGQLRQVGRPAGTLTILSDWAKEYSEAM